MKKIFLILCFIFISTNQLVAQEINVNEYSSKIIGQWELLNFDAKEGEYSISNTIYRFKNNNFLEIVENNKVIQTLTYQVILTNNYQNIFISTRENLKLAILKTIDVDDSDFEDSYSMNILYNDTHKLILGLEFPGGRYTSMTLRKKD